MEMEIIQKLSLKFIITTLFYFFLTLYGNVSAQENKNQSA